MSVAPDIDQLKSTVEWQALSIAKLEAENRMLRDRASAAESDCENMQIVLTTARAVLDRFDRDVLAHPALLGLQPGEADNSEVAELRRALAQLQGTPE